MAFTEWNPEVRAKVLAKYPDLEGKSDGIIFCAAVLEVQPGLKLNDMKAVGQTFAPELTFSPVSITSAEVAMGIRERKPRRTRRTARKSASNESPIATPQIGSSRMAKIERRIGTALAVFEEFEHATKALDTARTKLHSLTPSVLSLISELDVDAASIIEREGLLTEDED